MLQKSSFTTKNFKRIIIIRKNYKNISLDFAQIPLLEFNGCGAIIIVEY